MTFDVGYSMQRRSGRGQTAGTGRARGSASGIGEAASSKLLSSHRHNIFFFFLSGQYSYL